MDHATTTPWPVIPYPESNRNCAYLTPTWFTVHGAFGTVFSAAFTQSRGLMDPPDREACFGIPSVVRDSNPRIAGWKPAALATSPTTHGAWGSPDPLRRFFTSTAHVLHEGLEPSPQG